MERYRTLPLARELNLRNRSNIKKLDHKRCKVLTEEIVSTVVLFLKKSTIMTFKILQFANLDFNFKCYNRSL